MRALRSHSGPWEHNLMAERGSPSFPYYISA
jgi:hypothetical protein